MRRELQGVPSSNSHLQTPAFVHMARHCLSHYKLYHKTWMWFCVASLKYFHSACLCNIFIFVSDIRFKIRIKLRYIFLIQRLTAHYFKSPVQPIADEISGIVILLRNLTAVKDSQWEFNTAPRTLPIQIWTCPNQSDESCEGGVYGHLVKFVRPAPQRQNSL